MRYTLITQVALISLSLIMIFTFIKPLYAEIETTQNDLAEYSNAVSKAELFNARLRELTTTRDSFSQRDIEILEDFIPTEIDSVKVMKDIEGIFIQNYVPMTSLASTEKVSESSENIAFESSETPGEESNSSSYQDLSYQDFEVQFVGTYEELKWILRATESSATLLEIIDLSFTPVLASEGAPAVDLYTFAMTLRAYGLAPNQ